MTCRITSGLLIAFSPDCVLYRNIYSIQECLTLQEDPTSLRQWEVDWQIKFNVAKCHSMRVTRHQHHKHILFDYSLHNQTLENVQSAKYIGIIISDNMDGVSTFQKFLPKQLRHLVSFAGTWLSHLRLQRNLHAKLWFGLYYSMQHPFGALTRNFKLTW